MMTVGSQMVTKQTSNCTFYRYRYFKPNPNNKLRKQRNQQNQNTPHPAGFILTAQEAKLSPQSKSGLKPTRRTADISVSE